MHLIVLKIGLDSFKTEIYSPLREQVFEGCARYATFPTCTVSISKVS